MDPLAAHQRAQRVFSGVLADSRQHIADILRAHGNVYGRAQPSDQGQPPADQLAAFLGRAVG